MPGQAGSGSGLPWAWQLRDVIGWKYILFWRDKGFLPGHLPFWIFFKTFQDIPESFCGFFQSVRSLQQSEAPPLGRRCARVRMSSAISSEFSFSVMVGRSFQLSKILHIDLELWQLGWCFGFGKWCLNRFRHCSALTIVDIIPLSVLSEMKWRALFLIEVLHTSTRPSMTPLSTWGTPGSRRMVHQV